MAPDQRKPDDRKWGSIRGNTAPFSRVDFRRCRSAEIVHCIFRPFLRRTIRKLGLIALLLFVGCSGMEKSEKEKIRRQNCKGELIYRNCNEELYSIASLTPQPRPRYPWEGENHLPRITKDFFRCKGNVLNSPYVAGENQAELLHDCEGSGRHGFPIIHGKENVYPILIDLLNYVQKKTAKRVIITCGHRCPPHNTYADPTKENLASKHQIGAEVDFYVQGMEDYALEVVGTLMQYYQESPAYAKDKDYQEFKRFTGSGVETDPWMNKEIVIKLYEREEGRDGDNRHPHPYISIQVRYDRVTKEKVLYNWQKAHKGYPKS